MKHFRDERGVALVLEVVLVALVSAGVGFAVYMSVHSKKTQTATNPTPSISPSSSASPTPTPTNKTQFTGSSLRFNYPSSWQLVQTGEIGNLYNSANPYVKGSTNNPPVIGVSTQADTDNGSIDAYLNRTYSGSGATVTSKTLEQVGGKQAYRVKNSFSQLAVYVFANGKRFEFDNQMPANAEDSQTFEQLLSTVQFK